jgi:two-component system sensor histidine kinase TctE
MKVMSLRMRLALIILIPLILISALGGYWRYSEARQTAEELFDRTLLTSTMAIARDVAFSDGDALSATTRDMIRDASGGPIFYHVNGPDGVYVTGYATPPVAPSSMAQVTGEPVFFQSLYRGEEVRVVRLREAGEVEGVTGFSVVTVWQSFDGRHQFARDLAVRAAMLMATLILTVAAVVWLGINFGLRPLTDLQRAISRRSSDDLGQIKRPLPREVSGLVATINTLFKQVEESMKSKDDFISDAAHQLRNPIAGVLSMAEAVSSAKTTEDVAERTDELVNAARHASRLANQMLSYERARSGAAPRSNSAFDLCETAKEVAGRNSDRISGRGIELSLSLTASPVMLSGERVLISEAIENLIDNALRHGGPKVSRISIKVAQEKNSAVISVADDGRGIKREDRARAFERFSQLEPRDGSGLGLAIVSTITRNHGGSVVIEDAGDGALITMRIPLTLEAAA